MKKSTKAMAAGMLALLLVRRFPPATPWAECAKIKPTGRERSILWRGLANIFSLGMDEMGKEFTRWA